MFKTSSEVAPLLVRLYDSHRLYTLLKDEKDPHAKWELTSAVIDLLAVPLSPHEQELLADVLIALLRQAESDLRAAVSERMSVMDDMPLRLALHFANDEIQIARPLLKKAALFSDLDLIYIVKSKGPEYWQAIASREQLSAQLIDVLADTRDSGTAVALSENERITLTHHAMTVLSEVAQDEEAVARPLLNRPELPEALARRLYACVGEELKNTIRQRYGEESAQVLEDTLEDIVIEFSDAPVATATAEKEKDESPYAPSMDMINAARQYAEKGRLTLDAVFKPLRRGQISSFVALFAQYTGMPVEKMQRVLMQSCGKGLAVVCRANSLQKNDFSQIYLLTHRMRSTSQLVEQKDLMMGLRYFDRLRPEVARRILHKAAEF